MQYAATCQGNQPFIIQKVTAFTANEALVATFTATSGILHVGQKQILSDRLDAFKRRGDREMPFAVRLRGQHALYMWMVGFGSIPERPVALDELIELR
jgi:hypothetical protein